MKRKPELARMWVNELTGEYHFEYEPPMPNIAKAIAVCLALTIPFWVMS